jgi:hypothetical protein
VLRREKLNEIYSGRACPVVSEQIDVGRSPFVDAGLVGKKTDALSANQMYAVAHQNGYPGPHLGLRELGCGVDLLAGNNTAAAEREEHCEQPMVSHHRYLSGNLVVSVV